MTTKLPSRADHVGSFLRPKSVLDARDARAAGTIDAAELRAVEDQAIADLVKWQESLGLQAITDGEFRRVFFHTDFLLQLSGVEETGGIKKAFHNDKGVDVHFAPPKIVITGKVAHVKPIQRADYAFLAGQVTKTAKVTIPSPTMLHFRAGRAGIPEDVYPTMEEFYADVAAAYRAEIDSLVGAGCRYIQMDDTNLAYLCDDEQRAEIMFNELEIDAFFLEYDDPRSGDFAPLRFLPKGKTVVLGLVTTKLGELETKDDVKRRIDEATKFVDIDQLALSPQCGFASTVHGNDITTEQQADKIRLVIEVAEEVWGSVPAMAD